MRRLIFAVVLALFLFGLVVFVLSNHNPATFGYDMVFRFHIPYLLDRATKPIPLGYVVMIVFCVGMITTPFLEALPSLYKSLELRAKNKRIRQLERELTLVREMMDAERTAPASAAPSVAMTHVADKPLVES